MAALDEFRRDNTHAVRAKTHAAIHQYIECLHPLVGYEAAFRYEASWRAFEDASARAERRKIAEADRPALDALNAALIKELDRELLNAGLTFVNEQVILKTALDNAWKRDERREP